MTLAVGSDLVIEHALTSGGTFPFQTIPLNKAALTPKALLFYGSQALATGGIADALHCMGFAIGAEPNQAGIFGASRDAANTSVAKRGYSTGDNFIRFQSPGNTNLGRARLVSVAAGSFVIEWTTTPAAAYTMAFEIWGGSGIQVAFGSKRKPNSDGDQDILGMGFTGSDLNTGLFVMSAQITIATDDHLSTCFGFATSATKQFCLGVESDHNSGAADTRRVCRSTDRIMGMLTLTDVTVNEAKFKTWKTDGCTLTWAPTDGTNRDFLWMAINGMSFDVTAETILNSGVTHTSSGLPFRPGGCLRVSHGTTETALSGGSMTVQTSHSYSFGGAVGSAAAEQSACWTGDLDGADPMQAKSYQLDGAVWVQRVIGAAGADGQLVVTSVTADGMVHAKTAPAANAFSPAAWWQEDEDEPPPPGSDETTLGNWQVGEGIKPTVVVVEIGGRPYLLHSHSDNAAVLEAYDDETEHTEARGGLLIPEVYKQEIDPFRPKLAGGSLVLKFRQPDPGEEDTGEEMHATALQTGIETQLTDSIDCDDTDVPLRDPASLPASGTVNVGTEHIAYSAKDSNSVTASARGLYAPFKADSETEQRWAQPHRLSEIGPDIFVEPAVTDYPKHWKGRHVVVRVHTLTDGVLNSRANAYVYFQGKIQDVGDDEDLNTVLSCTDMVEHLQGATLLKEQYSATVRDGIYLREGWAFDAHEEAYLDTGLGLTRIFNDADPLTVVSGASGTNEIEPGYYTVDELMAKLNEWFAGELAGARLDQEWGAGVFTVGGAYRFGVATTEWDTDLGTLGYAFIRFTMKRQVGTFLGFTEFTGTVSGDPAIGGRVYITSDMFDALHAANVGFPAPYIRSQGKPLRTLAFQRTDEDAVLATQLEVENVNGTFIEQDAFRPALLGTGAAAADGWCFLLVGDVVIMAHRSSDTLFDEFNWSHAVGVTFGTSITVLTPDNAPRIEYGDAGTIPVKQIVVLEGQRDKVFLALITSTGTNLYNGEDDVLPYGLAGGLPRECLGDDGVASFEALAALTETATITVLLDRPKSLAAVLLPDLALLNAHIVYQAGTTGACGLRAVVPSIPRAANANYVFNTLTDAKRPAGSKAPLATTGIRDGSKVITRVKVEYNTDLSGRLRDVINVENVSADTDAGGSVKPITVEARNTFGGGTQFTESVKQATAGLAGQALSLFGMPPMRLSSTFGPDLFDMYPGATVAVTDLKTRSPLTGQRGLVSWPAYCVSVAPNLKLGVGEALFLAPANGDPDRRGLYSPGADVDDTQANAGYNAGALTLICYAHEYTFSSEAADASFFPAGSKIVIHSRPTPETPTPISWERTVASQTGNNLVLTAALSSPAWDATLKYFITSQLYSAAVAAQKVDSYLADDADGLIEGVSIPKLWSTDPLNRPLDLAPIAADTNLAELTATSPNLTAEGRPCNPSRHRGIARTITNFLNYKSASQAPILVGNVNRYYSTEARGDEWMGVMVYPLPLGRGKWPAGWTRTLRVAVHLRTSDAASEARCRVTSCGIIPAGTSFAETVFAGPYRQTGTFATNSTTWEAQAQDELEIVRTLDDRLTFLVVELQSEDPNEEAQTRGYVECWLGPLEPA